MNKNPLKLLLIPLIIAALYFIVQSFFLVNQFGISSVVEEISLDYKKTNQQDAHILKGQKTRAIFKASDNNLGILFVPLVKFGQGGGDTAFRIGEEEDGKWHHKSTFRGDQVQNNQYFPLGFPPVSNSKNNKYVFEIESLNGSYQSGIGIIKDKPARLLYKYSIRDLTDLKTTWSFVSKKFIYVLKNINYTQLAAVFVISSFLVYIKKKTKVTAIKAVRFLSMLKKDRKSILKLLIRKKVDFSKKPTHWLSSTTFYVLFLNTNTKKRVAIGVLMFLLALTYRFAASLVNLDKLFYAELGGGGDYDQFIRAATCALNFCSWIIHQNLLIESSILGIFYEIFGFTGGIKAYLYLMIILSSIVATLPYFILSRKNWISLGGILGSIFLATSDFLTHVALNFPPDNGSLFTFSIFFIIYFLTLHIGTIRWLLFFGLMGLIDGLNKALFLINDLAALLLFIPVFFFQKSKKINKFPFVKLNSKLILYSAIPLLIFLTIYSAWEYIVYIKFIAPYFLRGLLLSRGESYIAYTTFDNGSLAGSLLSQSLNLSISAIVMIKRLIQYADLPIIFLATIFFGMLFFSFIKLPTKIKFPVVKFIVASILSIIIIVLLTFIKNDYFNIHQIFAGEYIIDSWSDQTYIGIFLFAEIVILFILNFGYQALKLSLPIVPYVVMLIILTKNSPFPRISTHVIVWSIILFSFLFSWLLLNISLLSKKKTKDVIGYALLILFIVLYALPKASTMVTRLYSGIDSMQRETKYLQWVNSSLPNSAIILAGGKSDLVQVAGNIKRPVVYNTSWVAALLIEPNKIPGVSPTDFSLMNELQNKEGFKKNKYFILEDDISLWRARLTGVGDGLFTADPKNTSALHAPDYSIKVYKSNPTLKKAIYELTTR